MVGNQGGWERVVQCEDVIFVVEWMRGFGLRYMVVVGVGDDVGKRRSSQSKARARSGQVQVRPGQERDQRDVMPIQGFPAVRQTSHYIPSSFSIFISSSNSSTTMNDPQEID